MTNETKHTPGPWQVNHRNPHQVCDADGDVRGCAAIAAMHGTAAEKSANAQLIARAPTLLAENETLRQQNAELVRALEFVRNDANTDLDYETRLIINAALAKVQS